MILRHDSYETHPSRPSEEELDFRTWLQSIFRAGKGAQIDLKEGADTLERMLAVLRDVAMPGERLWFTTNLKDVAMEDYARLAREFPRVPVQSAIPLRFMFQEMGRDEREAWLELNRGLGVRHLAMSWYDEPKTSELEEIRQAGFGVHFFYVNSAEDIRRAVSLGPDSITSDFHIPEWGVFGRGSGENGFYLEKS